MFFLPMGWCPTVQFHIIGMLEHVWWGETLNFVSHSGKNRNCWMSFHRLPLSARLPALLLPLNGPWPQKSSPIWLFTVPTVVCQAHIIHSMICSQYLGSWMPWHLRPQWVGFVGGYSLATERPLSGFSGGDELGTVPPTQDQRPSTFCLSHHHNLERIRQLFQFHLLVLLRPVFKCTPAI